MKYCENAKCVTAVGGGFRGACELQVQERLAIHRVIQKTGTRLSACGRLRAAAGSLAAAVCLVSAVSAAPPAVLQRGYDASLTGANLAETTLTTANVGPNTFGLLFKLPVDDAIFAQPLYVPNVAIPNQGTHNVVYIATMSDSVYAFDADTGAPLWHINLATLVNAQVVPVASFAHMGNKNIVGNLGVLSTPVIDPVTNIMYVVACTLEGGTMAYRLHALDITSGAEPLGPGVAITGSTNRPDFVPAQQFQRVSLVLAAGQVVIGFSAMELESSTQVYSGWVMAYSQTTLQQTGVFATLTSGNGAGVWQSGRPPVVDSAGYVYLFTGNGYSGTGYDGINNFSESALKLDPAHGLALVDWFTPSNWSAMDTADQDLSSSGPLMIPGSSPPVLAGGGKTTYIYLLNSTNLGKIATGDTQIIQKLNISNSEFRGGPVYWQRSSKSPLLYNWAASDWAKAYAFNGTTLSTTPTDQQPGSVRQLWPGGIMALSANGEQAGTGILWATVTTGGNNENNPPTAGELRALDASNLAAPTDLWNSGDERHAGRLRQLCKVRAAYGGERQGIRRHLVEPGGRVRPAFELHGPANPGDFRAAEHERGQRPRGRHRDQHRHNRAAHQQHRHWRSRCEPVCPDQYLRHIGGYRRLVHDQRSLQPDRRCCQHRDAQHKHQCWRGHAVGHPERLGCNACVHGHTDRARLRLSGYDRCQRRAGGDADKYRNGGAVR